MSAYSVSSFIAPTPSIPAAALASPSPPRPATTATNVAAAIVGFAVSQGVAFERICERTGLDLTSLLRPETRIPDEALGALWTFVASELPGRAIGIEMAKVAPLSFLGPAVQATRYAPTPRAAMQAFLRYRELISTDVQLSVREGPEETMLSMHHPLDEIDYVAAAPEVVLGLSVRFHRELLGVGWALRRVEFVHQPCAPRSVYTEFFGVDVRFGRPANAVVLHTTALDRRVEGSDRLRFHALQAHLDAMHESPAAAIASEELRRVQEAIAENAHEGEFGAEALAKRLGTSLRSLERRVRAHDTTVRRLLEQSRRSHARRLLRDPRLSLDEIATRLGYSAESAFRRAFKRWSGTSPGAFRRSLRANT